MPTQQRSNIYATFKLLNINVNTQTLIHRSLITPKLWLRGFSGLQVQLCKLIVPSY